MKRTADERLAGHRVLLVEDEWFVANQIASAFRQVGARVVGMAPTVRQALRVIEDHSQLDGAVIDLDLRGEMAYPIVDRLEERGVPYILATAFEEYQIAPEYRNVPRCSKPFAGRDVAGFYSRLMNGATDAVSVSGIRSRGENGLLAQVDPELRGRLAQHFERFEISARRRLETANRPIESCIFLETGMATHWMRSPDGQSIEVAMSGPEGMTGIGALLGRSTAVFDTIMQVDGIGLKIAPDALLGLIGEHPQLGDILRGYVHALNHQMAESLLASGRFRIEERFARWLLMMSDRLEDGVIPFSHESIAFALGVRRASITGAVNDFKSRGLITAHRGEVRICDRGGLLDATRGCYTPIVIDRQ